MKPAENFLTVLLNVFKKPSPYHDFWTAPDINSQNVLEEVYIK